jgi:hypothetical protein
MKAESPEVQGVIQNVFNRWDPAVFMDCHTTNGSYHVEPVTFTWMVNPNGDKALIDYMRTKMMPVMSGMLLNKYKVENCFYGEFIDMMKPENGWLYEVADPRYMSNYFGLRNRLGILNENYVYADYKSRVLGCYFLIKSLLDYSSTHNAEIKSMLNSADQKVIARGMNPSVTDSFAIEFKVRPISEKVTIKTFEAEIVSDANGRKSYRKSDRQKTVTVPYYIDYYPAKNVMFPFAYVLTVNDKEIIDLLKIHGIELGKLSSPVKTEVEKFEISSLKGAARRRSGELILFHEKFANPGKNNRSLFLGHCRDLRDTRIVLAHRFRAVTPRLDLGQRHILFADPLGRLNALCPCPRRLCPCYTAFRSRTGRIPKNEDARSAGKIGDGHKILRTSRDSAHQQSPNNG